MRDHETTTRSRELGNELRRIREKAGYGTTELARRLGWTPSRVSRLESGKRGASEVHVATFVAYCRVTGRKRDQLLALARDTYERTWLQSHCGGLPDELRTLVFHEATASTISSYEPLVVPGLLQTENYARALFGWARLIPDDGIEVRIRARMDRQNLLRRREPPEVTFYIPERVLRSSVGSMRVMNEQLLHLVLVTARQRCTIRVLPDAAGPHGALGGPFRLMEYAQHAPVAYVENQNSSVFLEAPPDVVIYQATLNRLAEVALDGGQSRELIVRLANDYDQPEEGSDEHD